jgi:predicted ATP-dependent Lon-type protease
MFQLLYGWQPSPSSRPAAGTRATKSVARPNRGSINPVPNAVGVVEQAVERGARQVLMPVSTRKQLNDLSDDMAAKIFVQYYADPRDALLKALSE